MNAMAQQDEARRQEETRNLSPELTEILHMLNALETQFARDASVD